MGAAPKVDVNFLKPFLEGALETLSVQCGIKAVAGRPYRREASEQPMAVDIAGIIGVTSKVFNGSIALCFPKATFLSVMEGMLGERFEDITDDLEDGAGELLNIIFGYAKRNLNAKGYEIEKAIPSVIRGEGINVRHISKAPTVIIPFSSPNGDFFIELVLD